MLASLRNAPKERNSHAAADPESQPARAKCLVHHGRRFRPGGASGDGGALLVARSQEADRLVDHTFDVQIAGQSLQNHVQAAENSQRGFLITGDTDYLKRFDDAIVKMPALSASLRQLTADNPQQQARLDKLEPLIKAWLNRIKRSIDLSKQGNKEAAFRSSKEAKAKC